MIRSDFENLIAKVEGQALKVSRSKSKDYATDDVLSNFKRMSTLVSTLLRKEITPSDMAMILVCLKLDRLYNLQGKSPENESVWDTWLDLTNYIRLFFGLEKESTDVASSAGCVGTDAGSNSGSDRPASASSGD